uniref:U1-lycotoxin-Ls1t n=1 Tax=Lycosa singoriensis TaxID=434756 RepID=TX135_LYCSI|nr:RecName: Full=U1-lycotoxin-Ls1t; AltName: Full=Toxin-like structure LSTX-A35; Flags: Precursor [Lycosa singoriensis]ACI41290.1 toxin-like structure LSTX-A35 precursor [Lycosa singoriensis]CAS03560.1 toxin-like structure LSTX-A35 precursor [Lycosa singoriensis]
MMKVLVVVALLVTLISYSSSEGIDDLEADELLSLMANEQTRKECIPKHHECTSDKHGCCRGNFFKYKCQCTTVVTQDGEQTERCFCGTPPHHKAAELVVGFGKKIFG